MPAGNINYRKPIMTEHGIGTLKNTAVIRPAMLLYSKHGVNDSTIICPVGVDDSGNGTHGSRCLSVNALL